MFLTSFHVSEVSSWTAVDEGSSVRQAVPAFRTVWELIRPLFEVGGGSGQGELMILAGWGGIPDLGSCPQGIAVMWQLICGYYQRPKDLFCLKCQ